MAATIEEVARVVAQKAKKIGLTIRQLNLVLDLSEDLEKYAEVETFAFRRVDIGSVLTMISINARYQVWLIKSEHESISDMSDKMHNCAVVTPGSLVSNWRLNRLPKDGETILRCYAEFFDTRVNLAIEGMIWNSDDSAESFFGLRAKIGWLEGFEFGTLDQWKAKENISVSGETKNQIPEKIAPTNDGIATGNSR